MISIHRSMQGIVAGVALAATGCAVAPASFESAEAAADALHSAVQNRDRAAVRRVLGSDYRHLGSGDERRDHADFQRFAAALARQRRVIPRDDGAHALLVGPDEFEFPAPIVKDERGFHFDTAAGVEEMRIRRIGWGELSAIESLALLADAQRDYFAMDPDGDGVKCYAATFRSAAGRRDGLWWPEETGAPVSPMGPAAAAAVAAGDLDAQAPGPQPYRGYFFRVLAASGAGAPGGVRSYVDDAGRMTGGFAFIAWPADYDRTGIMTFIAGEDGLVHERDLGPGTAGVVREILAFDPGREWKRVE